MSDRTTVARQIAKRKPAAFEVKPARVKRTRIEGWPARVRMEHEAALRFLTWNRKAA